MKFNKGDMIYNPNNHIIAKIVDIYNNHYLLHRVNYFYDKELPIYLVDSVYLPL